MEASFPIDSGKSGRSLWNSKPFPYPLIREVLPSEIFPAFSRIFSPKSIFSGHSLFLSSGCCWFEHFKGVFGHSRFSRSQENLGNTDFFWQESSWNISACPGAARTFQSHQNPAGSSGNSHPARFRRARKSRNVFHLGTGGEMGNSQGIPGCGQGFLRDRVGICSPCVK